MDIRGWETIHYFRHQCHSQFPYSANHPSASGDDGDDDDGDVDDDDNNDSDDEDDVTNAVDDYHYPNDNSLHILVESRGDLIMITGDCYH